nr:FAD:protein FMN transferase [uncultured Caproiciproducens sp.]
MVKKLIAMILALTLIFQLPACNTNKKTRYEAQFLQLFDTMTEIVAYTETKEEFTNLSNLIYNNLKVYHELYDIYDDYPGINNIKTINDNAGKKPVKVDKKIIDLLLFAKNESRDEKPVFNIALGSVLKIWHQYREAGIDDPESAALPPMADLKAAMQHTDINKVIIDEKASTVYLEDPKMSLDVGAAAKGYATEQVAQIAIAKGYKSALLSVGGNVRAIGDKGVNSEQWNVGIQNPDSESNKKSLCTVNLTNQSVVTSGIYERYYTVDGKNYHHIIDPKTLMPSTYFKAVTIITQNSGMADALSTIVFNMPYEQGLAYIRTLPDTQALWVLPDNSIKYSDHFQKYIKK